MKNQNEIVHQLYIYLKNLKISLSFLIATNSIRLRGNRYEMK